MRASCLFFLLAGAIVGAAALAISPATVLAVVEEESGSRVWCAAPPPWGTWTVRYLSRNSIYGVLAEESWRPDAAGITIERVHSTPGVLEYYGIADYRVLPDGTAEGTPLVARYAEMRLKASPRGEQRVIAGSEQLNISARFAEGSVLVVGPRQGALLAPCLFP